MLWFYTINQSKSWSQNTLISEPLFIHLDKERWTHLFLILWICQRLKWIPSLFLPSAFIQLTCHFYMLQKYKIFLHWDLLIFVRNLNSNNITFLFSIMKTLIFSLYLFKLDCSEKDRQNQIPPNHYHQFWFLNYSAL